MSLRLIGQIAHIRQLERQCQSNTRRSRAVLSVIAWADNSCVKAWPTSAHPICMPRFTVCGMAVPYCQFKGRPQSLTLYIYTKINEGIEGIFYGVEIWQSRLDMELWSTEALEEIATPIIPVGNFYMKALQYLFAILKFLHVYRCNKKAAWTVSIPMSNIQHPDSGRKGPLSFYSTSRQACFNPGLSRQP